LRAAPYRDSEVTADHPLAEVLATLARQPVTERISLSGLEVGDVADYINATTDADVPAELVHTVHRRTDGNPFFVAELVRLLASEGRLDDVDVAGTPIPAGVRDVIRQRVGRLPQDGQAFLTVAAVVGRQFA